MTVSREASPASAVLLRRVGAHRARPRVTGATPTRRARGAARGLLAPPPRGVSCRCEGGDACARGGSLRATSSPRRASFLRARAAAMSRPPRPSVGKTQQRRLRGSARHSGCLRSAVRRTSAPIDGRRPAATVDERRAARASRGARADGGLGGRGAARRARRGTAATGERESSACALRWWRGRHRGVNFWRRARTRKRRLDHRPPSLDRGARSLRRAFLTAHASRARRVPTPPTVERRARRRSRDTRHPGVDGAERGLTALRR